MTDQRTARKSYSLLELADHLGAALDGPSDAQITGVAGIETATPRDVTFVSNPRYAAMAETTQAGAILVKPDFPALQVPTLRLANPYLAFARALELFHPAPVYPPGIHSTAVVDPSASLGANVHLGPYVVVMSDVVVGDGAVILAHSVLYPGIQAGHRLFVHAHVVIRENSRLGDDVILQSGAVIGGDGFGFAKDVVGAWQKIPQTGATVLEDRVEVQANACIDRASVGETRVGAGSKIDNLVQVGHGSRIGNDTLLCSQVGLAGSSRVGNRVILAGQVGVAGHCTVGDDVTATAQSGIPGDVAPGSVISGYPAIENRKWLKNVAALNRLPDLIRNLHKERK